MQFFPNYLITLTCHLARMRAGGRDDGINTLRSHQYNHVDEGVTEEIKRQTFSQHCFAPHRNKVLMRGLLDQSVRDSPVGLLSDLLAPGSVMSLSTSINSLSRSRSDILRLSVALPAVRSVASVLYRL